MGRICWHGHNLPFSILPGLFSWIIQFLLDMFKVAFLSVFDYCITTIVATYLHILGGLHLPFLILAMAPQIDAHACHSLPENVFTFNVGISLIIVECNVLHVGMNCHFYCLVVQNIGI